MNYIRKKLQNLKENFQRIRLLPVIKQNPPSVNHIADDSNTPRSLQQQGRDGELFVMQWLAQQGYIILKHSYRTRFGEIDIIASHENLVAFVEVKMRQQNYFDLSQVITVTKQRKIIKSAYEFIVRHADVCTDRTFRFDVALLEYVQGQPQLRYIPNAFTDTLQHSM